jgi:cystathionine beta-lyase/cystathionine gamma-synthase
MAALTATLLAVCGETRRVVALRPLYGGSDHLLACGLLGLDVAWADGLEELARSVRAGAGLVVLETPQNPTLGQVSIEAVVEVAGAVPVLVDNTFATPILQQPARHGAAFTLQSATLGGHGDVVAASSRAAGHPRRQCVAARSSTLRRVLLHRAFPTPFRVEARRAERAGRLEAIRRDGSLPGPDSRQLLGPGRSRPSAGIRRRAGRWLVRLVTPAVSLGCVDVIQHPAGLTHRAVDERARTASGIGDGLLRLSVGLEDVDDLWRDLEAALSVAAAGGHASPRPALLSF